MNRNPTRREVLGGMGMGAAATLIGCGKGGAAGGPPVDGSIDASPDGASETACTATSALSPEQLLAHVETLVVLCMENRSFDHYLGSLRLREGRHDVDGLTGAEVNLSANNQPIGVHLLEDLTVEDPPHTWEACREQWNGGANDGFVRSYPGPHEAEVMGYHVRSQIPVTYALADAGVVCNRWFPSCLGPTFPNRLYLHGATAKGIRGNRPVLGLTSIFDRLEDAKVPALNYFSDIPFATTGYGKLSGFAGIEQFFEHAQAGTLPSVAFLDPSFVGGGGNDDHPDRDIRLGQVLISSVVTALAQSPQWNRCLFVLIYDEHGGFYDHVPPPQAIDDHPDFRQMGFRIPALVVGPTVRRGCAVDDVLEHCAIAATATRRWQLEPLNARAAAAGDLSVCIDPQRIDDPLPPPTLPPVEISRAAFAERQARARQSGHISHPDIVSIMDAMSVPRELDRRGEADAVAQRVLAWGERLGTVRLVD